MISGHGKTEGCEKGKIESKRSRRETKICALSGTVEKKRDYFLQ